MTVKEASEQQSPVKRQNNFFFSFCCFFVFFKEKYSAGGTVLFSLLPVSGSQSVSGYGAVPAAGPTTGLLLGVQLQLLTRVLALPQTRGLQDLLHQLLEGTLDAIFGLCTGLCAKERRDGTNGTSVILNDRFKNTTLRRMKTSSLLIKSTSLLLS